MDVKTKTLDENATNEVFNQLKKTAAESVAYVAFGNVYARELSEKYGEDVKSDLHEIASALINSITELQCC